VGLLVGIVVVLVLFLDGLLGGRPGFATAAPGVGPLLAGLSAAALLELYALLEKAGVPAHAGYGAAASAALLVLRGLLPAAGVRPGDSRAAGEIGLLLAAILPLLAGIALRGPEGRTGPEALRRAAGTVFGLLVVHLPLALLLELRLVASVEGMGSRVPPGLVLVTAAAAACKAGDTAAYFVGRTIGRRSLCWVSPKKTWEGAAAGALTATATAGFLGVPFGLPLPLGLAFGLVTGLAGQAGDLLESYLKRCCGAKDSGRTFGEMGGALDLVDALLLAGPAAYLFHRVVLA